jgi:hypothetical protein
MNVLPALFSKYLDDAKKFWEVDLCMSLRQNNSTIPAKWKVSETTAEHVVIEYSKEMVKYPVWAVRVVAFHEICHLKQALEGLPLLCICDKGNAAEQKEFNTLAQKLSKFNVGQLDLKPFSHEFGLGKSDIATLFQTVYVMATDKLVNFELIRASPVGFDNVRLGIVTVTGDYDMLRNRHKRLAGIVESGLWDVTSKNICLDTYSYLASALADRIKTVEQEAIVKYGLRHKSYENYLFSLSQVKSTNDQKYFVNTIKALIVAVVSILRETNSLVDRIG